MTATASTPSSSRRRAVLVRLLVGSLTLLVLLGASCFDAAAANISISQHAFVQLCKDSGGTPTRVSTYVVKCTYPSGAASTCNFVTKQCTDTGTDLPITAGGNASPISGGDVPIGGHVVFGGDGDSPGGQTGGDASMLTAPDAGGSGDGTAAPSDPTPPSGAQPAPAPAPKPHKGHKHHGHQPGQAVPVAGTAKATQAAAHHAKGKLAPHGKHGAK